MNGFWYPAVIALTFSAVLTLQSGLKLNALVPAEELPQPPKAPSASQPSPDRAEASSPAVSKTAVPAAPTDEADTLDEADRSSEAVAARDYQRAVELANQAVKAYSDAATPAMLRQ